MLSKQDLMETLRLLEDSLLDYLFPTVNSITLILKRLVVHIMYIVKRLRTVSQLLLLVFNVVLST